MRTLTFLLLLITGLALALPGAYLAMLGGSLYYLIAGVLILVSAFLVQRGSGLGIGLFWLVLLGTPNCGSFAAVQAVRGTYAVVRRLAQLAARASAEELAAQVFNTFPSLYDLLPTGACDRRARLLHEDSKRGE